MMEHIMESGQVYLSSHNDNVATTCQKQCPLSVITNYIPQFEELLELYYHCKLCAAPQAYLEAQTFVEHVQECHAEYVPTGKGGNQEIMIAYPESKTASLQANEEDIQKENKETVVKDASKTEISFIEAATESNEVPPVIKEERDEGMDTEDTVSEEEADIDEGIDDTKPTDTPPHTSNASVTEIKGEGGGDVELVIEWPEGMDGQLASQDQKMKMLEEITSKIVKQEGEQQIIREAETNQQLSNKLDTIDHVTADHMSNGQEKDEWEGHMTSDQLPGDHVNNEWEGHVTDDLEDEFSGHVAEPVTEHVRYRLTDEVRKFFEAQKHGKLVEKNSKKPTSFPPPVKLNSEAHIYGDMGESSSLPSSQESDGLEKYIVVAQEDKSQFTQRPGTSECWQCHRWYKPRHHASCKRRHTSEKPACDAYVCVADYAHPVYTCRFCNRIFVFEDALVDHLACHVTPLNLKCDLCSKTFAHTAKLQAHLSRCAGDVVYKCPVCPNKLFNMKSNFTRHLGLHGENSKRFVCEFCGKGFSSKNSMIIHTRNHTGEKPFSCQICSKSFKSQSHLIRHSYTHTEHKKYICETCGKGYVDKSGLLRHLPIHTEEGKPVESHPCPTCHKILRSKRQLEEHIKTFHSSLTAEELRRFECDICHKRYRTKRNLVIHKMIHTGTKPYTCDICGKGFYKSSDVTIHRRIHTGEKPYKCEHCPRSFSNLSNHHKHQLIHTGERPFKCKFCTKTFNDPSHVTRHTRIHTGEKPFSCETCDRAFATKQQMQNHAMVHSTMHPYMCAVCGKTFRQRAKAKKHQCLWGTLAGQQRGASIQETPQFEADGNHLVVEEAGEEFSKQISIEQGSDRLIVKEDFSKQIAIEQGGERLIVKVVGEGAASGDHIAVHMMDEYNRPIGEQVSYHVVQDGTTVAIQEQEVPRV